MAPRSSGFGLYEAVVALVLLAVGLLAVAGLVRSVAEQTERARAIGETALVAQQILEQALADSAGATAPMSDTVWHGARGYAALRRIDPVAPRLQRIRISVTLAGSPGFGRRLPGSVYATYRTLADPRPVPP